MYSEKATEYDYISKFYLNLLVNKKNLLDIFVAFSEYMNFIIKYQWLYWFIDLQREVRFSESFCFDLHYKMIFICFVFDEKS